MTQVQTKTADIRFRVELRAHSSIVIYKVKSSDGKRDYETTLVNGKISSCTCPAHQKQNVRCYIMRDVLAKEAEVQARKASEEKHLMDTFSTEIAADSAVNQVLQAKRLALALSQPKPTPVEPTEASE